MPMKERPNPDVINNDELFPILKSFEIPIIFTPLLVPKPKATDQALSVISDLLSESLLNINSFLSNSISSNSQTKIFFPDCILIYS